MNLQSNNNTKYSSAKAHPKEQWVYWVYLQSMNERLCTKVWTTSKQFLHMWWLNVGCQLDCIWNQLNPSSWAVYEGFPRLSHLRSEPILSLSPISCCHPTWKVTEDRSFCFLPACPRSCWQAHLFYGWGTPSLVWEPSWWLQCRLKTAWSSSLVPSGLSIRSGQLRHPVCGHYQILGLSVRRQALLDYLDHSVEITRICF